MISSWAVVSGLIPEQEIIAIFANKSKQSEKKGVEDNVEIIE